MRVIIQNDKKRLFVRADNALSERTKLNEDVLVSSSSIPVINAHGFAVNDFILLNNFDNDRAEITKISSIVNNTLYINPVLGFAHDNKTDVHKMDYDHVWFYENDTVINTVAISADYYTTSSNAITESNSYSVLFKNSQTSATSPRGEAIHGYEYMLCGIGDITQLETMDIITGRIIDKIDIATRVIRSKFTTQGQNFDDLANPGILRLPCAYLALHYYFIELMKAKDDISGMKSDMYLQKYDAEISRAMDLINAKEDNIKIFGQSRAIR